MRKSIKVMMLCGAMLVLLMCTTQPSAMPAALLMLPFMLMFVVLALGVGVIIGWRQGSFSGKSLRIGCVVAVLPVILLILQSAGQLTLRDTLTLFILFLVTYFYMTKVNAIAR